MKMRGQEKENVKENSKEKEDNMRKSNFQKDNRE